MLPDLEPFLGRIRALFPDTRTLWSLLGFPALTLPTGLSEGGLPYGMQLAARALADNHLLRVASWCEAAIGFNRFPG